MDHGRYLDCISKTAINSSAVFNKDMVVLDFGCGIGRITKHFSEFVNKMIGGRYNRRYAQCSKTKK